MLAATEINSNLFLIVKPFSVLLAGYPLRIPVYHKLKGLGHAILGNFSTDQIVIELVRISKQRLTTIEEL